MRLVVTGASGMLGQALARVMDTGEVAYRPCSYPGLDVTDRGSVAATLRAESPDFVIHAAAFTNVDDCEDNPEHAYAVNAEGTRNVVDAASAVGARVLYVSTDYVFDGRKRSPYTEEDDPVPLNVYGASKIAGERAVQAGLPEGQWVIVRTAWLYGDGGRNFVDQIVERAKAGGPLTVVDDQVGNPTWTMEVARAIRVIVEAKLFGVYHVVCSGLASWFELAEEILRLTGIQVPLKSITTADLGRPAKRASNSALDTTKFQRDTGVALETWKGALGTYLKERRLVAGAH